MKNIKIPKNSRIPLGLLRFTKLCISFAPAFRLDSLHNTLCNVVNYEALYKDVGTHT
jgi:hypothetical protein